MPASTPENTLINVADTLQTRGLLFLGAHANLSLREGDRVLMTRGGSVADLHADDLVWLDLNVEAAEQPFEPAYREIISMHTRLYQAREDVGAIIHCHPRHATAFAVAQRAVPAVYEPMLRQDIHRDVPVVPWAPRGSSASVDGILRAFEDPAHVAVLLANHGALVTGATPEQALSRLTAIEEGAEVVLNAIALGGAQPLPDAAYAEVAARMRTFESAA
ncbi:class II aldolase/adducin family protein [Acidihalobacter ferrooxydans]|uniref:Class II aldolase/adducin N-terminal domain-containing protein n=1 Tax=Acidihalobacter ferrooxydans TaxID=1765967 RepID=A0A1P8UG52_9GAMM|nr:class II aldolase/adducin family protein [Acidihalobacter ferrooxydans]APZ42795.1 hypothetical protein BW247_06570 [Acidihalobacter ferrooxydans]